MRGKRCGDALLLRGGAADLVAYFRESPQCGDDRSFLPDAARAIEVLQKLAHPRVDAFGKVELLLATQPIVFQCCLRPLKGTGPILGCTKVCAGPLLGGDLASALKGATGAKLTEYRRTSRSAVNSDRWIANRGHRHCPVQELQSRR